MQPVTSLKFEKSEFDNDRWAEIVNDRPAVGQGLNAWLYRAARFLLRSLEPEEALQTLQKAVEGVKGIRKGELARTIKNASGVHVHDDRKEFKPWPILDEKKRAKIVETVDGSAFLKSSPVDVETLATGDVIDQLFPGDPLLCCGLTKFKFETATRNEWRDELKSLEFIVPSAMTARRGLTKEGKESAHCLENTGPRQYLVIEQDTGCAEEQMAILAHLSWRAPLVMAVHSGSKSIHGWFNVQDWGEDAARSFMEYAVSLGADKATWTRSQFVRMPGGTRESGRLQSVLFFNPKALNATSTNKEAA